jgi:aminoglycoside 3-N-acetyltransferase
MIVPEVGPDDNALNYGSGVTANRMAEFFTPDMSADRLMGTVAESFRRRPGVGRSLHPILSFCGMNAQAALDSQTLDEPLAPIHALHLDGGWVLLLGVNHTVNTSIHYAERMAGRRQFVRWALTQHGVVECPGFPGCSEGFQLLVPHMVEVTRSVLIGRGVVTAMPLREMVSKVRDLIAQDPAALLCSRPDCERCQAVRAGMATHE